MPTPSIPAGFRSIDEAAAELTTTPLGVQRLLAKSRLRGNRLGPNGPWRISTDAIAAYIQANAPDLEIPARSGPWYARDVRAEEFADAITNAADDQLLSDARAEELLRDAGTAGAHQLVVELSLSAAIAGVIRSPVPGRDPSRFDNWGDLHIGHALCRAAKVAIDHRPTIGQGPLPRLFERVDTYREVVDEAADTVLAGRIAFSRHYTVAGLRTVVYVLKHSTWHSTASLRLVSEAAF